MNEFKFVNSVFSTLTFLLFYIILVIFTFFFIKCMFGNNIIKARDYNEMNKDIEDFF